MSVSIPTTQTVRRVLEQALGEGRLAGVADSKPLLRAGVITSIELVTILLDLEKAFDRKISPPDPASVTIQSLTRLAGGESATEDNAESVAPRGYGIVGALARRPLVAAGTIAVWLFAIDALAGYACRVWLAPQYAEFMEGSKRLYPRGTGNFSQDDFRFAVAQHEISTAISQPTRQAVFLGDSGTIGTLLEPDEALPAQVERELNARQPGWRVHNLAWYARLMPKDLMILDAVWDKPFDTAIFTVGDPYFSKRNSRLWIDGFQHTTVNIPLFDEFTGRVPADERAAFEEVGRRVRASDLRQLGPLRRFAFDHFSLPHYQPFFYFLASGYYFRPLFGPMWNDLYRLRGKRIAMERTDTPMDLVPADDIDPALTSMMGSAIRALNRRGVKTFLFVQPAGPRERMAEISPVNALSIANELCARDGCAVVNERWGVPAPEFLDMLKHYTIEGNRRLAAPIAQAILRAQPVKEGGDVR